MWRRCKRDRIASACGVIYVRMSCANVLETLNEDELHAARLERAPARRVLFEHLLRHALLPIVTPLGLDIGLALGGASFSETGLGRHGLPSASTDPRIRLA